MKTIIRRALLSDIEMIEYIAKSEELNIICRKEKSLL